MNLEIQVSQVATRVVDIEGREYEATFYLHSVGLLATREESLGERLNAPGHFLPCTIDGEKRLVPIKRIAYVEVMGAASDLADRDERGARHTPIEAELVTGERLEGELIHESPESQARLSDALNRPGTRFLLVIHEGRTLYLHRDTISWVRL
jgi:hypothetical protein